MTRVFLIRHGYTDWMEKEILHGTSDRPLSAFGNQQADATAKYLKDTLFDRIYTSPLLRAKQTADKIAEAVGKKPVYVENLKEEFYGVLEGKRDWWATIKSKPLIIPFYAYTRIAISSITGEPFWLFKRRVIHAWEEIKAAHPTGSIGIVAHSGVLRHILRHEFGGSRFSGEYSLTACSVSEIEINEEGKSRIIKLNQNAHIPGENFL